MKIQATAQTLIKASAEDVFEAFLFGQVMRQFWFYRPDGPLLIGASNRWSLGAEPDAFSFAVDVQLIRPGEHIAFTWGEADARSAVTIDVEARDAGCSLLRIVERGYGGTDDEQVARALDSSGGFNQVVIAAKAWLEYGARINVVESHA